MNYQIPILFLFFNRKEIAINSFEKIKQIKPSSLFLACDGPRDGISNENELVYQLREEIVNLVDWDCNVQKLFQEKNIGCSKAVYTAVTWMFSTVDKGIILEDDCIPQKSFFPYVEELLNLYENDERIGMIAGYNKLGQTNITDSYCFSKYKSCWGWATWNRAWKNMDLELKWRSTEYASSILYNMGYKSADISDWQYKLKAIDKKIVSAWDWQWYLSLACQNQLTIFPNTSLVTNNGFGKGATHTYIQPEFAIAKAEMRFPLKHPRYIVPNKSFDYAFYKVKNTFLRKIKNKMPIALIQLIKKIIRLVI